MIGVLISVLFFLMWFIFTVVNVGKHFSNPDKKFKQETYMLDDLRGKLVVSVEGEDTLTIPFYKMGELRIDETTFISISEEGYGFLAISDIFVNGHSMFDHCPRGMEWRNRVDYCLSMMRTQGLGSGQVTPKTITEIAKVQCDMDELNQLVRDKRLGLKHDKDGEPFYFYYV